MVSPRAGKRYLSKTCPLPPFTASSISSSILSPGTQSEGIFRVSGSRRAIDALRAKIDRDGEAEAALAALAQDKGADGDIHTVTGALKLFLVRQDQGGQL